jgi:hypothetical protein
VTRRILFISNLPVEQPTFRVEHTTFRTIPPKSPKRLDTFLLMANQSRRTALLPFTRSFRKGSTSLNRSKESSKMFRSESASSKGHASSKYLPLRFMSAAILVFLLLCKPSDGEASSTLHRRAQTMTRGVNNPGGSPPPTGGGKGGSNQSSPKGPPIDNPTSAPTLGKTSQPSAVSSAVPTPDNTESDPASGRVSFSTSPSLQPTPEPSKEPTQASAVPTQDGSEGGSAETPGEDGAEGIDNSDNGDGSVELSITAGTSTSSSLNMHRFQVEHRYSLFIFLLLLQQFSVMVFLLPERKNYGGNMRSNWKIPLPTPWMQMHQSK